MGRWVQGNQNVQIAHVVGSSIQVTYAGRQRKVPLQPAIVRVGKNVSSPARLLRARGGVISYVDRAGVLGDLEGWVTAVTAFAGRVLGGRGGSGKTRLGVELCARAGAAGWLCGLLAPSADQAALQTLIDVPTARLIVVDYAESWVEQLDAILPQLAVNASEQHPVRVLLLVRAGPASWTHQWCLRTCRLPMRCGGRCLRWLAPRSLLGRPAWAARPSRPMSWEGRSLRAR